MKTKITTSQLAETRSFFESIFDLVVVEQWDEPADKGVILEFAGGTREALLEILAGDEPARHHGIGLRFRVPDVKALVADLPPHIAFDGPNARPWGSTYVHLRDPKGIKVIVYEGGW